MIRRFASFFICLLLLSAPALAADAPAFTAAQKAEINNMIKKYIADNPQEMVSSVQAFYMKQQAANGGNDQGGQLTTIPAGLYDDPNSPSIGPKDAKVTMVEFFDYNCGYCKQSSADVQRLVNENKSSVRFIFKDLPILSDTSEVAARYALAANKQGKYLEYHMALMTHHGPITEDYLQSAAKDVGLDVDKLKKDITTDTSIRDTLQKDVDLARALGVRGTPFFLIGKEKVPGAIGYAQMKSLLDKASGITSPITSAAPDTSGSEPSPMASATSEATKADIDAQIAKAKHDTQAMIDEIKNQAIDMQKAQAVVAEQAAKQQAAQVEAAKKADSAAAAK